MDVPVGIANFFAAAANVLYIYTYIYILYQEGSDTDIITVIMNHFFVCYIVVIIMGKDGKLIL